MNKRDWVRRPASRIEDSVLDLNKLSSMEFCVSVMGMGEHVYSCVFYLNCKRLGMNKDGYTALINELTITDDGVVLYNNQKVDLICKINGTVIEYYVQQMVTNTINGWIGNIISGVNIPNALKGFRSNPKIIDEYKTAPIVFGESCRHCGGSGRVMRSVINGKAIKICDKCEGMGVIIDVEEVK